MRSVLAISFMILGILAGNGYAAEFETTARLSPKELVAMHDRTTTTFTFIGDQMLLDKTAHSLAIEEWCGVPVSDDRLAQVSQVLGKRLGVNEADFEKLKLLPALAARDVNHGFSGLVRSEMQWGLQRLKWPLVIKTKGETIGTPLRPNRITCQNGLIPGDSDSRIAAAIYMGEVKEKALALGRVTNLAEACYWPAPDGLLTRSLPENRADVPLQKELETLGKQDKQVYASAADYHAKQLAGAKAAQPVVINDRDAQCGRGAFLTEDQGGGVWESETSMRYRLVLKDGQTPNAETQTKHTFIACVMAFVEKSKAAGQTFENREDVFKAAPCGEPPGGMPKP